MLVVQTQREYSIPGEIDGEKFEIKYNFKTKTDLTRSDLAEIRKQLTDAEFEDQEGDESKNFVANKGLEIMLITSIVDVSDNFIDQQTQKKVELTLANKKALFDLISRDSDHMSNAVTAMLGLDLKNLNNGVTQPLTGNGVTPDAMNVENVTSEIEIKQENV